MEPTHSSSEDATGKLRAFVALRVTDTPALTQILSALAELGRTVRPVSADGLHLTLKFLGETATEQISEIGARLIRVAEDWPPFALSLQGVGAFPDWKRPRVIWCGIEPVTELTTLAGQVEAALEPLGFPREQRGFQAHVTLARVRPGPPVAWQALRSRAEEASFGHQQSSEIELLSSEPGPRGVTYRTVLEAAFSSAADKS